MRLIDADALITDLEHDVAIDEDMLDYEEMTEDRREIIQFDKDCKQNAIDLLNHTPTIEPKKGRWIPHTEKSREYIGTVLVNVEYDYWFCDICGYWMEKGQPLYDFCPNCGADMRGE